MNKTIFYNSSLPRAGSTLFQNIVGQNPDFYVTPTSGLIELVGGARNDYNNSQEVRAQDPSTMERAFIDFCREGMQGFFMKKSTYLTLKYLITDIGSLKKMNSI
jgi:sulfotransferase